MEVGRKNSSLPNLCVHVGSVKLGSKITGMFNVAPL